MKTKKQNSTEQRQQIGAVSSDLSRIVGEQGLMKLSLDSIQTLNPGQLQDAALKMPDFRPQMMLTLLTYCYSSSIYGSKDVEWAIENDRMVRYICARTRPDWQSMRRFRRQNRDLLFQSLLYVLKQTWALKFDQGEADAFFDSKKHRVQRNSRFRQNFDARHDDGRGNNRHVFLR